MKHDVFVLQEAGYQAAMRDYATYGKPMKSNYPGWEEDKPFETGYENYVYERKQERLNEIRE
ncbi:MAG: hypothetical protein ABWY25_11730 [Paenisporosarcina sp.]